MATVEKGMEFLFIKENVTDSFLQEIQAFWLLKVTSQVFGPNNLGHESKTRIG